MFTVFKTRLLHLLAVSSLVVHLATGQTSTSTADDREADQQIDCSQLRLQMSQLFRQTFQKKVPVNYLNKFLPLWVESTLPSRCVFHKNVVSQFNSAFQIDNMGPLVTFGPTDSIFTESLSANWPAEKGFEARMGENTTWTKESGIDPMVKFARHNGDVFTDKSQWNPKFLRPKRFVGGFGAGGLGSMFGGIGAPADPGAPPREITEAEQTMNTLLMFTNLQKALYATELGRFRKGSQSYDKPSLTNGMYGDQYHGRRRREAIPLSRRKRFLFAASEPGDPLQINPLFDIYGMMAGTAVDPNTGNRVEFGGDTMTNMAAHTYMSILPMANPPQPGHEPPEMFKNMANIWYLNTLQNVFNPPQPRSYPTQIKRNGYYGDTFPGKKRKKRAVSFRADVLAKDPLGLLRSKRQAEEVKLETTPAITPQKPVAFYGNQAFYGDPLYPTGQATDYDRAMLSFRRILLRNQKLRQQYEKQRESLYAPFGNYRSPERAQYTNTNFQQQQPYAPASSLSVPQPTRVIPYQAHPTFRPAVDPFILLPVTKESFDPFAQGLDPFIPNPTTTPEPTTTVPPAESGKRKKRSDEGVTASEEARTRLKRANSHTEFETRYPDFYNPLPLYNGFSTNDFGLSKRFFNPYENRYFSNGGYDNLRPYKSSYLAKNGEVIYGDRPSWSSNGHSGNSRSKRSGGSNNDFFFFGGFEGERNNKKEEKSDEKKFYGNGFEGQYYGEYLPWNFNGEYQSEKYRSKRSEGRNHDFFYYGDHGYRKEEKDKEKNNYGNGFEGQFFGEYPWFSNGNYEGHSERSRSKRSDGGGHDFYHDWGYEGGHRGFPWDFRGYEKLSYSNGRGDRFYGDSVPNGSG